MKMLARVPRLVPRVAPVQRTCHDPGSSRRAYVDRSKARDRATAVKFLKLWKEEIESEHSSGHLQVSPNRAAALRR